MRVSVKVVEHVVAPPPKSYELKVLLTEQQATDILKLTEHIGGDPFTTTRGVFSDIGDSLRAAGVSTIGHNIDLDQTFVGVSEIYFR